MPRRIAPGEGDAEFIRGVEEDCEHSGDIWIAAAAKFRHAQAAQHNSISSSCSRSLIHDILHIRPNQVLSNAYPARDSPESAQVNSRSNE